MVREVAERAEVIEVLCGRCDRRGWLSVTRLLADYGRNAAMGAVLRARSAASRSATLRSFRADAPPTLPDLTRWSRRPEAG